MQEFTFNDNIILESIDEFYWLIIETEEVSKLNDTMKETKKTFTEKIAAIVDKVLKALKEFFIKVGKEIDIKIQQIKLNKKLDELKDLLAKKKAKALGTKIDYFDIRKYKEYYSDFIKKYTAELKRGLDRDFKSIQEYEQWRMDMVDKMSEFNYKLSDDEQWRLSIAVNSAIQLSTKEAERRKDNLKMVEEDGSNFIKSIEKNYQKIDIENSFVNTRDRIVDMATRNKVATILKSKTAFIAFVIGKIAQAIRTVARVITKHTALAITAILVILIAL